MRRSQPSVIDLTGWKPDSTAADLTPIPVPPLAAPADFPDQLETMHLDQTEPIDDPAGAALQLALLTATVRDLVARVEQLEARKTDGAT